MDGKKPYFAVLIIQTIYAGMFMISKAAFNGGMSNIVFVFYRQALATIILIPFAIIFEWKKAPPLTLVIFCKLFLLSLFGVTICLNVYGFGLIYTSASLAASISNTVPVITFLIALLLRMEVVNLRRISGVAKITGVVLCLGGALILALYKGPHLKAMPHPLFGHPTNSIHEVSSSFSKKWIKGCLLALTSNILWALWLILQVPVMKSYPSHLLFATLQCLLSSIQSFIIAIAFERNPYSWHLHFDVGLLAIAYTGIVVAAFAFYIQSWVIEKKGPVFVAMSMPLSLIITTISSTFLLGEVISLGSVLGGIVLVGGLYCVLWGKSKEEYKKSQTIEEGGNKELKDYPSDGIKLCSQEEESKTSTHLEKSEL